jgi:hypothetical protein
MRSLQGCMGLGRVDGSPLLRVGWWGPGVNQKERERWPCMVTGGPLWPCLTSSEVETSKGNWGGVEWAGQRKDGLCSLGNPPLLEQVALAIASLPCRANHPAFPGLVHTVSISSEYMQTKMASEGSVVSEGSGMRCPEGRSILQERFWLESLEKIQI